MHAPLMLNVEGTTLTAEDAEVLRHPAVGGVVLFTRNFESIEQLTALTGAIHALRSPPLAIAVDHEGGRVQRFHEGFTRVPAMGLIGAITDLERAERLAYDAGLVLGFELVAVGIDFSFAPVLDLHGVPSEVIGARAFHAEPARVAKLGARVIDGLRAAGLPAVGKHFPGHGSVRADSHVEIPVDERDYAAVCNRDLQPFVSCIEHGLKGIMSGHIRFPAVAAEPATFSRFWMHDVLRERLEFDGLVFTDDLGMGAARHFASAPQCVAQALQAGCDIAVLCNDRAAAVAALAVVPEGSCAARTRRAEQFWAVGGARATEAHYQTSRAALLAFAEREAC